jgi:glycosyltransferase involved in cell wall biosynthesis
MKIAIFHNYLDNIGGAEKVGLTLARELHADVYTTSIDTEKIATMGFADVLPRIYSIGTVPKNPPFRQQLAFLRFRFFKPKKQYDLYIIDGDWAMSGAVRNSPSIWYVHSPIREIWDLYKYTRKNTVPLLLRPAFDMWVLLNRLFNKRYAKCVTQLVCNSQNTQKRVKKFLKQNATVIYPPIATPKIKSSKGTYWLAVNRLISHKRVEVQLKAFAKLPQEKLIIVGSYEKGANHFESYRKKIEALLPPNVEIKHWVSDEELQSLYANCKGFITTAKDEDFGMTPVEAMMHGKPVIAAKEGGYIETVIHGKTGILVKPSVENIIAAVKKISENPSKYKTTCIKQAKKFSTKSFISQICKVIKKI